MFQKEMSERIIGKFKTSKYGRLSIITSYFLDMITKFDVSPNSFFPKPKVFSTVLHLKPKKKLYNKIRKIENLEKLLNLYFQIKER